MTSSQLLKTGGDPRLLPDYAALREELAKLSHPARPDVEWGRVTQLCLSLFDRNGVELQTAAWYTLARTRMAGIAGLNEGLATIGALIVSQWAAMWPQPVHARTEILASLSQRLQMVLRSLTLGYGDLPQVYLAEQHLNTILDALARLELKNASGLEVVHHYIRGASARLEKMSGNSQSPPPVALPAGPELEAMDFSPEAESPRVYVVHAPQREEDAPVQQVAQAASGPAWRAFAAGVLTAALLSGAGLWGWQKTHPQAGPLPVEASEKALTTLEHHSPLWLQNYGFTLAARAAPDVSARLKTQWQQQITGNALAEEALSGWHQGMAGLQELTRRLNALDERKGKYLTGSELKSMTFAITQSFERSVPVEERLYRLNMLPVGEPLAAAQLSQTDLYFTQLLNRYALIKQRIAAP